MNTETLQERAEQVAMEQSRVIDGMPKPPVVIDMKRSSAKLIESYRSIYSNIKHESNMVPAAEWLVDNFYIIEGHIKDIQFNLRNGYFKDLPVLKGADYREDLRVYEIAREIIDFTSGRLDSDIIYKFIDQYQKVTPLTISELWAIPLMLKIVLIQNIEYMAVDIENTQKLKYEGYRWGQRMIEAFEKSSVQLYAVLDQHDRHYKYMQMSYADSLLRCLQDHGAEAATIIKQIDRRLIRQGDSADSVAQREYKRQTEAKVSMGNVITSLKLVSEIRWEDIIEDLSLMDRVLRKDPAQIYGRMDFKSRDYYRKELAKLAKRADLDEVYVARLVLECIENRDDSMQDDIKFKHVGYYLVGKGRQILKDYIGLEDRRIYDRAKVYIGGIMGLTALCIGLFLLTSGILAEGFNALTILYILLALVPILSIVIGLANWLITTKYPPSILPRLELKDGIPKEFETMVITPTLLTSKKSVEELAKQMEVFYMANKDKRLHFAIVGDFKDGPNEYESSDDEIAQAGIEAIRALNAKYGEGIFFYFNRSRQWNEDQRLWMGWERKRGALVEFNRLLRGDGGTSYYIKEGDLSILPRIKYVITLDADTQLPRETAKELIGIMGHPLNRPVLNDDATLVVDGYGIIQPRIGVDIESAASSFFSLKFSGQAGIDPYTTAVSDIYQDLFKEGIFVGKGIYDVDIFLEVLDGAIPENSVLSHDLLEGSYIRTGLATDLEFIDGYPSHYVAYGMRQHRWTRGDWQLMPWLGKRSPLSLLSKWKILDNMRRSLVPTMLLFIFILGSLNILKGSKGWLALAILTVVYPFIIDTLDCLIGYYRHWRRQIGIDEIFSEIGSVIWQSTLFMVFIAYQGHLMLDAILRSIVRVFFTRKNMLEWVTAADTERRFTGNFADFITKMIYSIIIGMFQVMAILAIEGPNTIFALILAMIWIFAPWIAYIISRPIDYSSDKLEQQEIKTIRRLARKTWGYFEDFMTQENNWLPPDNYQLNPITGVAHRTSPTNIGLGLMSALAAKDLGYIGNLEFVERAKDTIATVEKLEKWEGHIYNWYDTRTLKPLIPAYVSTVDNGNLAGYLIVLIEELSRLREAPIVNSVVIEGLRDTIYAYSGREYEDILTVLPDEVVRRDFTLTRWKRLLDAQDSSPISRIESVVKAYKRELNTFLPWVGILADIPDFLLEDSLNERGLDEGLLEMLSKLNSPLSISEYIKGYEEILNILDEIDGGQKSRLAGAKSSDVSHKWVDEFKEAINLSHKGLQTFLADIDMLIERVEMLFMKMNFAKLYDNERELFSIGYDVESGQLTNSFYDILASEARQASLIAIGKGDVPKRHWFKMGRALTTIGNTKTLLSWSGTMFEYMMPLLVMRDYPYTLFNETYKGVIRGQIEYTRRRNLPWGISESGYNAFDRHFNYQYKAFGVPGLGLKSGLGEDLVITPYASVLALQVDKNLAMQNIHHLIEKGLEGEYGLFEAIDYTPSRLPRGKDSAVVESFMAHHKGMSLMAISNMLYDNVMQKRFHSHPIVRSVNLLLQERIPVKKVYLKDFIEPTLPVHRDLRTHSDKVRRFSSPRTQLPQVQILSNENLSTVITNSGGGYIKYKDAAISRWRQDTTKDDWGPSIYVQNLNSNNFWSATYMPCGHRADKYGVEFAVDRATFKRKDGSIKTRTDIIISPTQDVEIRRLTLKNTSSYRRVVDVTSYFELVIAPLISDIAHRAFNNLFVVTEFVPEYNALIARRRPGANLESDIWVVHSVLVEEGEDIGALQYETNRMKFIGRGRDTASPVSMDPGTPLSNTVGAVIDPIMSLRKRVGIDAGGSAKVSYITGAATSRDEAISLARENSSQGSIESAFELAWTRNQVELKYLGISLEDANFYQELASHILYHSPNKAGQGDIIVKNNRGRTALWAHGISGELPIVVIAIKSMAHISLVNKILSAHEYWHTKGLKVDIVVLNEYGSSYEQPITERLEEIISIGHCRDLKDCPGGIYLRQADQMEKDEIKAIISASALVLRGDDGNLEMQLYRRRPYILPKSVDRISSYKYVNVHPPKFPKDELMFYNGLGGFWQNGREYIMQLTEGMFTPAPWSNVIANESFGTLITELGTVYTWNKNSRENKLTTWSNDPVVDPPGEAIYIRDDKTGHAWTVTPSPIRGDGEYVIRHGQGYTTFEHNSHGMYCTQTVYVPRENPVKINMMTIHNPSSQPRDISIYYYCKWALGVDRTAGTEFIKSKYDRDLDVLLTSNPHNEEFIDEQAFMFSNKPIMSFTSDRGEFIGRGGNYKKPAALERIRLSNTAGAGFDPCGAIHIKVTIPGDSKENIALILGQSQDMRDIESLTAKYRRFENVSTELEKVKQFWDKTLETVQVNTPDQSFNILINRWLLYQTISSRLWARTAFYQAGGAYGYRDQLQDVLAVMHSHPKIARRQILLHAEHQFKEGDVQHWWHPPNRGVRTRITDDLLFLPFLTADYINVTGDESILDEGLSYLEDIELSPDEKDRYNSPRVSKDKESLYDHCIRAIERASKFGVHGLPLIGGGDWNDGMDRIGREGQGESIWLGWFMYRVLNDFIPICEMKGDMDRAKALSAIADKLLKSIEDHGWDGGWYRRAYFDDGTPLGSEYNDECQIDSISQSWSIISKGGRSERVKEAMRSLENHLIDRETGIIKLLWPPFFGTELDPGYIKGYVPGVRENGGQYTHAATWVILAYAMLKDGNIAMELYNMINPINHSKTPTEAFRYRVEPYVMAADVYSAPPYEGRGGWTWYTGAASWMYRIAIESLLGLKKKGDVLTIDPCIPTEWSEFTIRYRYINTLYSIRVRNGRDGQGDNIIHLKDDGGHHQIEINL
ncbi:MAG: glycosyl transferase [Clostridiales bacterium]|nr:glycosyl transferase [Clostridiales bacterium]